MKLRAKARVIWKPTKERGTVLFVVNSEAWIRWDNGREDKVSLVDIEDKKNLARLRGGGSKERE